MTTDTHYDVVIIGAGFAGAVAARELSAKGLRVCVVEARDRVGGRTWVDERLGQRLELGGTWVHWAQPHVWAELTRYGLEIEPSPAPELALICTTDQRVSLERTDFLARLTRLNALLFAGAERAFDFPYQPLRSFANSGADPSPTHVTVSPTVDTDTIASRINALQLSEIDYLLLRSYWTVAFNGNIDEASFAHAQRWMSLMDGNWQALFRACNGYKIVGGTAPLMQRILEDEVAELRLSTRVTSVESRERSARVSLADGSLVTARDVVVTAPLHALERIEFEPSLPEATSRTISRGHVGLGAKVWITVRGRQRHFVAFGDPDLPLNMIRSEFVRDDTTILVAFGASAERIDVTDLDQVRAAVRNLRDDLEVIDCAGHNWVEDPLAQSTWSMHRVGFLPDGLAAMQRPYGRVHFAGSDIAGGWSGFIDGAIESGLAVARRIIESSEQGRQPTST